MSRETIVSSFLAEMPMEAALVYSELGARVLLGGQPYAEWNPDTESWELYADEIAAAREQRGEDDL